MIDLIKEITNAIETQGVGDTIWRERDCVTFIRAIIKAHGVEPKFSLPQGYEHVESELEAIKETVKRFGSMEAGWIDAIMREPALMEWDKEPRTGMLFLSETEFTFNGQKGEHGPVIGVFGADLKPWARTPNGIAIVHPIKSIWRIAV